MNVNEAADKAQTNFKSGFNCAQSVFAVFAEELGLDLETALKISQGFGGGMGRQREVCGCVSGMIMAVSLLEGSSDSLDKKSIKKANKGSNSLKIALVTLLPCNHENSRIP